MAITASQVNELRQMTGAGMMACKKALEESNGDLDGAVDVLRKSGAAKAAKKAGRETSEWAVFTKVEWGKASIVLLWCETDFVARNDKFQEFGTKLAEQAFAEGANTAKTAGEAEVTNMIAVIGENLKLLDVQEVEAETVGVYVHSNQKIWVLIGLKWGTEEVAKDIAMHAAAMNPEFLHPSDVSDKLVAKEKEIWEAQLKEAGKPENIIGGIMKGKERKFRGENALTGQSFVKDPSKTVGDFAKDNWAEVVSFVRLSV